MCKPRNTHRSLKYNISDCSVCQLFVSHVFGFPAQNVGHFLVGFPVTLVFMRFWGAKKDFCQKFKKFKAVLMQKQIMKAKTRRLMSV